MRTLHYLFSFLLISLFMVPVQAQKKGIESINAHDLKKHMLFLASDELEGRNTGEPGLNVAAKYLAVQAEQLGLKPVDPDKDFLQPYVIREQTYDKESSQITISTSGMEPVISRDPFYFMQGADEDQTMIEGEVVFAGYGIHDEEHHYNDFENIDIEGKVVLIMTRAPLNEAGNQVQFDKEKWTGRQSTQHKLPYIYAQKPKAVLMVYDPKSGIRSIDDMNPRIADYLSKSRGLKSEENEISRDRIEPKVVMIHRSVANQLMEGTGESLEELQLAIDRNLTPQSFLIKDTHIEIKLKMKATDIEVSNVFGLIEGSDPEWKNEVVIYLAHFDHVGTDDQGGVFNGADDNASGTVALLEIAEAFLKEKKRTKRSIGILWVSAEEIGLFGSQYFAENPLVPTEKTAAVINLDMIGRIKSEEDVKSRRRDLSIVGGDTVKVIGGLQSKVLMNINLKTLEEMGLVGNYTYNDLNHPGNYFYRSDHINFAKKDIPVLFYSTGTHRDYHRITDVEALIDYDKFLKMTRFSYKAGFNVAQYGGPIEVDHPMSTW